MDLQHEAELTLSRLLPRLEDRFAEYAAAFSEGVGCSSRADQSVPFSDFVRDPLSNLRKSI